MRGGGEGEVGAAGSRGEMTQASRVSAEKPNDPYINRRHYDQTQVNTWKGTAHDQNKWRPLVNFLL